MVWRLRVEEVGFEAEGGVRLSGLLFVPDRVPAPSLVVCHGFDGRGFRGHGIFEQLARTACENGFISLVFDFRGCGSSGGEFGYGWGEQVDLSVAVDFLLSRRETAQNRVFVVGHSLGGSVALCVAERDKRVKGVVLWATPHDQAYYVKRFVGRMRGRFAYYLFLLVSYVDVAVPLSSLLGFRVFGIVLRPRDVRRRLMKLRESEVLSRLENVPVLIVNGSDDQLVELKEARWNYEAARGSKELAVIEGAGHVFQGREEETIDSTLSWLLRQVRGSASSSE